MSQTTLDIDLLRDATDATIGFLHTLVNPDRYYISLCCRNNWRH